MNDLRGPGIAEIYDGDLGKESLPAVSTVYHVLFNVCPEGMVIVKVEAGYGRKDHTPRSAVTFCLLNK